MASFFDELPLGVSAEEQDRAPNPVIKLPQDSFFISEVIDNVAHFGTMKVAAANDGVIQAVPLSVAGNGIIGPRKIGAAFPAHTKVVCYKPPGVPFCYVLGSIPDWSVSPNYNMVPDWIVPACRSGLGFDRVHRGALERESGPSGDINFAAGRPCDDLPGDMGYINEFGLSYGIGRLMAWLRASHFCSVEAFWVDNLLRLTGYNFEIMTSASELRAMNDEGEFTELMRWGPYPWETLGLMSHGEDFTRHDSEHWDSGRSGREPMEDDQAGIWRVQRFRGYLGDLERTIVALPVKEQITGDVAKMDMDITLPGLLDTGYHLDGRFHARSAKGILLEKTVAIPVPKEKIAPDDPTGDTTENYKAAGVWGEGDEHTKEEPVMKDDRPGLRSLMFYERHALICGYYDNLGFHRHEKDWLLPDERETVAALGLDKAIYDPDGSMDDMTFWMPLPKVRQVQLDHRGSTNYYSGRAAIQIDEDGSIVLEDAYGSQIRMEGGNIFLSARNDVILQPGRSAQVWAPYDLILKAGNSADLSASQGDVRVKAQGNLMLAAVDKGVLIESQFDSAKNGTEEPDWSQMGEDVESRGVLIKALASNVISMSKDAYFRAGAREQDQHSGQLHIDAGGGAGLTYAHGRDITLRAQNRLQAIVGSTGENDDTASLDMQKHAFVIGGQNLQSMTFGASAFTFGHETHENAMLIVLGNILGSKSLIIEEAGIIGGDVQVGKAIVGQSGLHVKGNAIFTGSIICENIAADKSSGFLASTGDAINASETLPPEHPTIGKERTDAAREQSRSTLETERLSDNELVTQLTEELYGETSCFASEELISDAVFSFRTPEQYGTENDFVWFETRWQEMNRKLFGKTAVWEEVALIAPGIGQETMPYPGFAIWEEEQALVTLKNKLFDFANGTSVPRVDIEDDNALGEVEIKTFKEAYVVTVQRRT